MSWIDMDLTIIRSVAKFDIIVAFTPLNQMKCPDPPRSVCRTTPSSTGPF